MSKEKLVDFELEDLEVEIKRLRSQIQRLKTELASLIDLLRLPSIFPMLDTTEKYKIEIAQQALKETKE